MNSNIGLQPPAGLPDAARISVVMPLFDKAPFIEEAVRSVLSSHPGVHELIVVDDGSRDDGPERVASLAEPRVRLIRQPNRGVSSARNLGLSVATGDWVALLDADDFWLPGYTGALQRLIRSYPHCEMVATGYCCEDDQGRRVPVTGAWNFPDDGTCVVDDFYDAMSRGHFCFTGSIAVRRSLIERCGLRFPLGEQLGEDLEFIFAAAEQTPVAVDPRMLVVYRDSDVGLRLSRKLRPARLTPFLRRLDQRLREPGFPEALRQGAENYVRNHLKFQIYYSVESRNRRKAWRFLRHRLIRSEPRTWATMLAALALPSSLVRTLRERRRAAQSEAG